MMKKLLSLFLVLCLIPGLAGCGGGKTPAVSADVSGSLVSGTSGTEAPEPNRDGPELTLWTYPVGRWGDPATVRKLMDQFRADTGISVRVEFLSYEDGDDRISTAITADKTPDLVLEGPERLVANWGAKGLMADLRDLLEDTDRAEILPAALNACTGEGGAVYAYPLAMTAHCMAVNLTAFQQAGADRYLDLTTHTWTTENYFKALEALTAEFGPEPVTAVYCAGQAGDQGTRALITNLCGGTFTNPEHTRYTWASEANVRAITRLRECGSVRFDTAMDGNDEIGRFYQGELKIANCWNIQQQLDPASAGTGAGRTVTGEEIVCMAFPTESGAPRLPGGIWGFGVFDHGDGEKLEAAKTFIRYFADSAHTAEAVQAASFFPVRTGAEGMDLGKVWTGNAAMEQYQVLMPYLGDYYQTASGWTRARTAWWNMLQQIGRGADVAEAAGAYEAEANAAAGN